MSHKFFYNNPLWYSITILFFLIPFYCVSQTPNRIYELEGKSLFYITEPTSTLDYPKLNVISSFENTEKYIKNIGFKKYSIIDNDTKVKATIEFSEDNSTGTFSIVEKGKKTNINFQVLISSRFTDYLTEEKLIKLLEYRIFDYKKNGIKNKWQVYPNEIQELKILSSTSLTNDLAYIKVFIDTKDSKNIYKRNNVILNLYVSCQQNFVLDSIFCDSFSSK